MLNPIKQAPIIETSNSPFNGINTTKDDDLLKQEGEYAINKLRPTINKNKYITIKSLYAGNNNMSKP